MEIKLIIFDCDGVLIDSETTYLAVEFEFLERKDITVDRDWYIDHFLALEQSKWRTQWSDLIEKHTGSPLTDDEYEAHKKESRTRVMDEISPMRGIETLLESLAVPACVASSTKKNLLPRKLELVGLKRYFGEGIYSGDLVENGKPAPDLFLYAAEKMGFAPEDCIVIEDSANGVRGAKAAGMFTIGFTGGGHAGPAHTPRLTEAGADHVVGSHQELGDWLSANTGAAFLTLHQHFETTDHIE